jgi:hypothetical protein
MNIQKGNFDTECQKLALTSPTSGSCSVGIVCLQTKDTEFDFLFVFVPEDSAEAKNIIKIYTSRCLIICSFFF